MSWDIDLIDEKAGLVRVPQFTEGGTYALGGSEQGSLNVTYNYGRHFPFSSLHGLTGRQSTGFLQHAVRRLGTKQSDDYWDPTEGNAGYACSILLAWAEQHPDAVWRVS